MSQPKRKRCKNCRKLRRITQFSLIRLAINNEGKELRNSICRFCNYDGLTIADRHKILREAYRNYLTWQDLLMVNHEETRVADTLTYRVPKEPGSDEMIPITVSFYDLERALKQFEEDTKKDGTVLSKRKEQAFYLNVIRDMLQRDVAEIMGITTVSVGQYVDSGMQQLCDYYFAEMDINPIKSASSKDE